MTDERGVGDTDVPMPVAERLTIALIPDAADAIRRLRIRTGWKKVDILNRAAVIYEFIDSETRSGKEVILRDQHGVEERVKII